MNKYDYSNLSLYEASNLSLILDFIEQVKKDDAQITADRLVRLLDYIGNNPTRNAFLAIVSQCLQAHKYDLPL